MTEGSLPLARQSPVNHGNTIMGKENKKTLLSKILYWQYSDNGALMKGNALLKYSVLCGILAVILPLIVLPVSGYTPVSIRSLPGRGFKKLISGKLPSALRGRINSLPSRLKKSLASTVIFMVQELLSVSLTPSARMD